VKRRPVSWLTLAVVAGIPLALVALGFGVAAWSDAQVHRLRSSAGLTAGTMAQPPAREATAAGAALVQRAVALGDISPAWTVAEPRHFDGAGRLTTSYEPDAERYRFWRACSAFVDHACFAHVAVQDASGIVVEWLAAHRAEMDAVERELEDVVSIADIDESQQWPGQGLRYELSYLVAGDALVASVEGDRERYERALAASGALSASWAPSDAPGNDDYWHRARTLMLLRHGVPRAPLAWIARLDAAPPRAHAHRALLLAAERRVTDARAAVARDVAIPSWVPAPVTEPVREAIGSPVTWAAAREVRWLAEVSERLAAVGSCDDPLEAWTDPPERPWRRGVDGTLADIGGALWVARREEIETALTRKVLAVRAGIGDPPPDGACALPQVVARVDPDGRHLVEWTGEVPPGDEASGTWPLATPFTFEQPEAPILATAPPGP
jgi:hypothetical protein